MDRGPAVALRVWLKNSPRGYTREQLMNLLHEDDRQVRRLIEEAVTTGELPIVCDREPRQPGRYRIAGADEFDRVRREHDELVERARSELARARGLLRAHERYHAAGQLFAPATPNVEGLYAQA